MASTNASKKPTAYQKKKKNQQMMKKIHITGAVFFAVAILFAFFLLSSASGVVGKAVSDFLKGLFGFGGNLVPVLLLYLGFLCFYETEPKPVIRKGIAAFLILTLVSAIIHIVIAPDIVENVATTLYHQGVALKTGGLLGGALACFFIYLFGRVGTMLVLAIVLVLMLIIQMPSVLVPVFNYFQNRPKKEKKEKPAREPAPAPAVSEPEPHKERPFKVDIPIPNTPPAENKVDIEPIQFEPEPVHPQTVEPQPVVTAPAPAPEKKEPPVPVAEIQKEINAEPPAESAYTYPPLTLLNRNTNSQSIDARADLQETADKLVNTLKSFGVETKILNVARGPAVTRYELQPSVGVKVSKIVNLADDIALNLASAGVRIEAPIPGKAAVGIEVANESVSSVFLREILESQAFKESKSKVSAALGRDITGTPIIMDVAKMPHVLIAGATGSGKSVCINTILTSILYKATPQEVRLLMVDPKVVELGVYNGIPHLLIPVVTDPKKAAGALNWAVNEMLNRYKLFAEANVRDCRGYNEFVKEKGEGEPLPEIVIIIDELADLMMAAPNDIEDAICRLAQMARAAGMHLIIATQRPSVDVITGVIKANIPSRISFAVSSQVDSRTILDMAGAEKLLGRGDMLYYPTGMPKPLRVQGCFVSDKEVEAVVDFIKKSQAADYNEGIIEQIDRAAEAQQKGSSKAADAGSDEDEMLEAAIEVVVEAGQASVSLLQRRLKLGYARAARIVDELEAKGIVGPYEGSKPRTVNLTRQQYLERKMAQADGDVPAPEPVPDEI